jgi:hypothetical protein
MKRLVFCLILFLSSYSLAAADFSARVISVFDGDTIEVLHNTHPERIRLSGTDCPEKGQPYGNAYGPPFGQTLTYRSDPLKESRSFSCNFNGCPFFLSFTYPLCCYIIFFP